MSDQTPASASLKLPENPNLEWLRKQAKTHLAEVRKTNPQAKLADAQFDLAKQYGFSSWRALKSHVDSLTIDGQFKQAVSSGDLPGLQALLEKYPDRLHGHFEPYGWSLLHGAAQGGHLAMVVYLLERGLDPNYRERGDNTYPMHWAAAAGHLEVVKHLADAGGDVVGGGEDHVEGVIGWVACWPISDDEKHRAVVDFLISRGARHHIFSAIAMNLADEVRRIVASDPAALNQRMRRSENNRTPLQFAVHLKRAQMVSLLVELGADPLAVDGWGMPVAGYATTSDIDLPVMRKIREMTLAELDSARRGRRPTNVGMLDLVAAAALRDWETSAQIVADNSELVRKSGALHVLSKRGDAPAVKWLLDHGADPSALWPHFDADVTPLHLAAFMDHPAVARLLLEAGADPTIRDNKHDSDALGWAEFFQRKEIVQMITDKAKNE